MLLSSALLLSYLFLGINAHQLSRDTTKNRFPWIQKFASIGDSYAAGLGAGPRVDPICSRYGHSYPGLLQLSYLGDNPNRTHQFLACSGATTADIIEKQIPELGHDLDLLTISAGGNDVGLSLILNNCVYQFMMASEEDCKKSIKEAGRLIANETNLYINVLNLLEAVVPKMNATSGLIYFTGYAGFFGVEDHLCDNVTWAVWRNIESEKQYLRLEVRKQLNEMVRAVNDVLRKATSFAGPNIRFIDWDAYIAQGRGRYCEAGIHEPDPNRIGLSFYEWETVDEDDNATALRLTGDDVYRGTFEGDIAERINKTLKEHPDWEFDPRMGYVDKEKWAMREQDMIEDIIWWLLPDAWKRVFHPRPVAHAIIAHLIVNDLGAKDDVEVDSVVILSMVAAAALVLVVALLLAFFCCVKKTEKKAWWLQGQVEAAVESDEETVVSPSMVESPTPIFKGYNTFA